MRMRWMPPFVLAAAMAVSCNQGDDRLMADAFAGMMERGEATIVIVGDSISGDETSISASTWGSFLKTRLVDRYGIHVGLINSSRQDETFAHAILHIQEDVFSFRPDVVFVMLGMNDFLDSEMDSENLKFVAKDYFSKLREQGAFTVVLTSTGYSDQAPESDSEYRLAAFNEKVIMEARVQHFPVIDTAKMMANLRRDDPRTFGSLYADSIHLNERGQDYLAGLIFDRIRAITDSEAGK
jgi:lysophospholipase L1-like esterase